MEVSVRELEQLAVHGLMHLGLSHSQATLAAAPYIDAELTGKTTHGLAKLFLLSEALTRPRGLPRVVHEAFNHVLIDGAGEIGALVAPRAIEEAVNRSQRYGSSIVGMRNLFYYPTLGYYARLIALQGHISIITNNGGPSVVAPLGTSQPLTGTNPIAIAVPHEDDAIVFDIATSEQPWGAVNRSLLTNTPLPPHAFFDSQGEITTDPHSAVAVKSFGGPKGAGLNFMLEILTGAFVGAHMGNDVNDAYDLGYLFITLRYDMFHNSEAFRSAVKTLIHDYQSAPPIDAHAKPRIPGEQSCLLRKRAQDSGITSVDPTLWSRLHQFSQGKPSVNKEKLAP